MGLLIREMSSQARRFGASCFCVLRLERSRIQIDVSFKHTRNQGAGKYTPANEITIKSKYSCQSEICVQMCFAIKFIMMEL